MLISGDTVVLEKDKVAKIVWDDAVAAKQPASASFLQNNATGDGPYATPEDTFRRWHKALRKGDIEAMANCFVTGSQALMLQKLEGLSKNERRQMKKDAKKTKFVLLPPEFNGEQATLRVERTFKDDMRVEVLNFALENNLWKLVPNS